MKCIKCNHENLNGTGFCENCGNPINNSEAFALSESLADVVGDFCSSCGKPLEEDATFCAECGVGQEIICPKCETINPVGAIFCQNCAMTFPVICPLCKTENTEGAEFCENCGAKIDLRKRSIVKHPVFIIAASILLLVSGSYLFMSNRINHFVEIAENSYNLEKYDDAKASLKNAEQFCFLPHQNKFVHKKYKIFLDMLIEKGNNYTSKNKFKSAKKIYASAELFTKTSSQKDFLADNVSDYKSKKNSYYAKLRRQRQYSSSSSYSSGSNNVTNANVYFNWSKGSCWSREYSVNVTTSNYSTTITNSNGVAIIYNSSGVAGNYNFSLTVRCGGTYPASGSFYIDGRRKSYEVVIDPYGNISVSYL